MYTGRHLSAGVASLLQWPVRVKRGELQCHAQHKIYSCIDTNDQLLEHYSHLALEQWNQRLSKCKWKRCDTFGTKMLPADSPVLVKEREPGRAGTFHDDRAGGSKNAEWKLLQGPNTEWLFHYRISSIWKRQSFNGIGRDLQDYELNQMT